jgi:uncharacterized SAM-binding protein YcdF (DUF218 family)
MNTPRMFFDPGFTWPVTIRGKARGRKLVALLLFLGVLGIGWAAHDWILRNVAALWVISDQVSPVDAIVVLGGRVDIRPAAAAELYQRGLALQILIPRNEDVVDRQILLRLGIPSHAIMTYGDNLSNTYDEAHGVAEWMTRSGAKRIIVITELFGSRRIGWIFNRMLISIGAEVQVFVLTPQEYNLDNWWQTKGGVLGLQNEVLKYLYYRMRY